MNTSIAKTLSILTVFLLLTSVSAVQVNSVYAENTSKTPMLKFLADQLIEIANKSKVKVEEVFDKIKTQYIGIPHEAEELYGEGVKLLDDAISYRNNGDYPNACKYAIKAMQKFKLALLVTYKFTLKLEVRKVENETLKITCLRKAIERAYMFADRVEALANSTEEKFGYNLTTVKLKIEEAREHLENATNLLDEGLVDEAAKELAIARGILGKCVGEIHSAAKKFKITRAEYFLNQTKKRLKSHMEEVISSINRTSILNKTGISQALQNASHSIEVAEEFIKRGNVERALKKLEEVREHVEESTSELENIKPDVAKMLRKVNTFEIKLRWLEGMLKHMKFKGPGLTTAEDKLEEVKNLIKKVSDQIKNQKISEAEETIEHLEELLEDVEEMLSS